MGDLWCMGSGTTLIAAETTGRTCLGIELDPLYVDVAVRRWQAFTGKKALLLADGKAFDTIAARRVSGSRPDQSQVATARRPRRHGVKDDRD
jgi:hypothetical protein